MAQRGSRRRARHGGAHVGVVAAAARAQLGVSVRGAMVGSVSGGCIEGAVVKEALAVIATASRGS